MAHLNLTQYIVPFPVPSTLAASFLNENTNWRPDMLHIDAAHEYDDILEDIKVGGPGCVGGMPLLAHAARGLQLSDAGRARQPAVRLRACQRLRPACQWHHGSCWVAPFLLPIAPRSTECAPDQQLTPKLLPAARSAGGPCSARAECCLATITPARKPALHDCLAQCKQRPVLGGTTAACRLHCWLACPLLGA
jgi:hypothetical protein